MKIVIAKYTENDYALVQKTLPDAFPTLEQHIEAIVTAAAEMQKQGYDVVFEECDAPGYFAFLRRNNARHSRQNIAAYVNAKHNGAEMKDYSELQHLNIKIIRE
jgi:predicted O-methyltransferase YrrM